MTLPGTTWPIAWVRGEVLPRVLLGRLQRQGDTLAVHVDVEDLDGDLVADLDDLGRVVDVLPGQLGDVDQAVNATEVDERTEVDDAADDTGADLPFWSSLRKVVRTSDWVCSSHARRDRTTLLRFLSSSMILASISLPTYGWRSRTRRISTRAMRISRAGRCRG